MPARRRTPVSQSSTALNPAGSFLCPPILVALAKLIVAKTQGGRGRAWARRGSFLSAEEGRKARICLPQRSLSYPISQRTHPSVPVSISLDLGRKSKKGCMQGDGTEFENNI